MSVICFRLQFVPVEEDRKRSFLPRLHWPIFCVLKMSNFTAACIIEAVSQLLPNYKYRTWDAKTRKLLSYQIVISGKIRYNISYSLKEFCNFCMLAQAKLESQRNDHVMKDDTI